MSASLVGSEMCIRDRPHPGRTSAKDCFPQCPALPSLKCLPWHGVRVEPCLLYTSDAADDM
eukprot:242421-Alexandrium_andersonii.AAC.1